MNEIVSVSFNLDTGELSWPDAKSAVAFRHLLAAFIGILEKLDRFENPEPHSRNRVIEWPDNKANGTPLPTITNIEAFLDAYRMTCRWNMQTDKREINIPGETYKVPEHKERDIITDILSLLARQGGPTVRLEDFLDRIAKKRAYNPDGG